MSNIAHILEELRRFTCYSQTTYIDFQVALNEQHRSIRLLLGKKKSAKKTKDLSEAIQKFDDAKRDMLVRFNRLIVRSTDNAFSILKSTKTDSELPRVCVKTVNGVHVMDLYRNGGGQKFKIEENTAFNRIYKGETRYYLENNIPNAAKTLDYVNSRVDGDLAKRYAPSDDVLIEASKSPYRDLDWRACWDIKLSDNEKAEANPKSFYKSTLVVPITLAEGMAKFFEETKKRLLGDIFNPEHPTMDEKSLLGFVCFDHLKTDYFAESDADIGWIYADAISLAFVADYILSGNSGTYLKAKQYLDSQEAEQRSKTNLSTSEDNKKPPVVSRGLIPEKGK